MEHAPNELHMVHHQLHAVSAYPPSVLVRAPWNDTVVIKRLLDIGVQSLLLPYVQNEEEARRAVAAVRYPPRGIRGVSSSSRSNRFGRVKDYFKRVDEEICLIVQIETRGVGTDREDSYHRRNRRTIHRTAGSGRQLRPARQSRSSGGGRDRDAIARIKKAGKAPVSWRSSRPTRRNGSNKARFVAVTSDQFLLVRETAAVAARFNGQVR